MTTMDILLGGIPRSGTTALARAVELHPDIFCWSSETALLPVIDELTRGLPMRAENLPGVAQMISRHLKSAIIDPGEWNRAKYEILPPAQITIEEIDELARTCSSVLQQRLPRQQALLECASLLRDFLGRHSDRRLVAEKTPSNVLLLHESSDIACRWLLTYREPFAVISSMSSRASDPWAGAMGGKIEQRIGLFLRHAREIPFARNNREAIAIDYDDLVTNPYGTLANVCVLLQVEPTLNFLKQVRRIIGGKPRIIGGKVVKDSWEQFDALDRWKILRLCSGEMQTFGYTEHYYKAQFDHMIQGLPQRLDPQIEPLYGIFEPPAAGELRWVQRSASLAVYAPQGVNVLTLTICNNISAVAEVARMFGIASEDWRVTALSDVGVQSPLPLSHCSLAKDFFGEWRIDLSEAKPVGHHGHWRLFKIDLETNFSFTPCFTLADSPDERALSVGLVGWRLE
jgi:hypothetical protein